MAKTKDKDGGGAAAAAAAPKKGAGKAKKVKKGKSGEGDAEGGKRKRRQRVPKRQQEAMADPRFAHIVTDKRFKPIKSVTSTVKVGKRFEGMFTEDEFNVGPGGASELRKFYRTAEDEERTARGDGDADGGSDGSASADEGEAALEDAGAGALGGARKAREVDVDDPRFAIDYSRGEVLLESSSDELDEGEGDTDDEGGIDVWMAGQPDLHEQVESTEEVGRRLAICNLDWARVRAADLFVLANSFKPETGVIESVTIYPSDFGLERMRVEATEGPGRFILEATGGPPPEDEDDEAAQARLRAYELSKLRYYYAVVVCDSPATAVAMYEETDGLEFEKSQNILDVRCVPDDVTFDNEPKDRCDALPAEIDFKLDALQQAPLAHTKAKLTWDDDDDAGDRVVLKKRKFTQEELEHIDYSNYLASSDSDSDAPDPADAEDAERKRRLLREMVAEAEAEEEAERPDGELEITFSVGLKDRAARLLAEREERAKEAQMTVGEKLEKKRREKKRLRKKKLKEMLAGGKGSGDDDDDEDLEARAGGNDPYFQQDLTADFSDDGEADNAFGAGRAVAADSDSGSSEPGAAAAGAADEGDSGDDDDAAGEPAAGALLDDDDSRHFDMTKIIKEHRSQGKKGKAKRGKKKRKTAAAGSSDECDGAGFRLDTKDERFAAVFTDKDYSIDPTRPEFKKTREMERLIAERQSKVRGGGGGGGVEPGRTPAARAAEPSHGQGSGPKDQTFGALVEKIKRAHGSKGKAKAAKARRV